MQMLYNSENFAVVLFDVAPHPIEGAGSVSAEAPRTGGYEIVDKFARKEIFIQGALAESFKQGVDALIQSGPTEEAIDGYIERFASLMQQPVVMH